ncbi:MAG: hydrogenase expression protein [Synergistes sp.]|nr:hydrogenase expression protein [Synergistes sp.]
MTEPNEKKIPSGKLSPEALKRNVLSYRGAEKAGLLIGPGVGEDAAVIKWPCGKYMIFASDPVVGAEKGAGRLLVRINSNDIASKGGDPEYLAVTLVLPPSFGEEGAARIMREIDEECRAQGIAVAGGHTEFNDRYDRPVIMGALVGSADMVMRASDISEGDVIIVTKHIGIEGMSIVAADRPELLSPFMSEEEISEILSWADMTSVLPEARILRRYAKFMHDPTEGGFCGGLDEICMLCGLSAKIDADALPIAELTARAAKKLGFDPLHLIASGSLLAVVPEVLAESALSDLRAAGIAAASVGSMGPPLPAPVPEPKEELWRLLKMGKENGE